MNTNNVEQYLNQTAAVREAHESGDAEAVDLQTEALYGLWLMLSDEEQTLVETKLVGRNVDRRLVSV